MAIKLTASQSQMLQLGRVPLQGRHRVDYVKVETSRAGLSHVVKTASKESKITHSVPLSLPLCATSNWDVVVSLNELVGGGCMGFGWLTAFCRGFQRLAESKQRDLCLWLEHAGNLRVQEQEIIAARAMWAADNAGINVHLIYLLQKIEKFDREQHRTVRGRNLSGQLFKGCTEWEFNDDGLESLLAETQPRELRRA